MLENIEIGFSNLLRELLNDTSTNYSRTDRTFIISCRMKYYFSLFLIYKNIFWGYTTIKELIINEQIRVPQVRLVGSQGEALGIMSLSDARAKADEEGLDLVLLSPNAVPPVCKIMDYGKHKFDTIKKEKEAKKKQKVSEVKGMQLSMNIADNDMQFKAKNVRKFLTNGDKVKVSLRMFGRQLANPQMGLPIRQKFYEMLCDVCELTSKPEINGRQIVMVLSPKNTK